MNADNGNELGKILKQRRVMIPRTLQELATAVGVSPSYLCRVERGERFPSARILQKIAKPLGFDEAELLTLAYYMTPKVSITVENEAQLGGLDPYVKAVLSQEPVGVQRAVILILSILTSFAKPVTRE